MSDTENKVAIDPNAELPEDLGITDADRQLDIDRDNRTIPVAKEVLRLMSESSDKLLTGSKIVPPDEKIALYIPIAEHLIGEMLKNDMRMSEIKWVFDMTNAILTNVTQMLERSMDDSAKNATAKLFGREHHKEIKVADIDAVIKAQ